jgi:hypothetical protein
MRNGVGVKMLKSDQCREYNKQRAQMVLCIYPDPRDAGQLHIRSNSGELDGNYNGLRLFFFGLGVLERNQHIRSDRKIVDSVATLGEDCGPNGS